MEKVIKFTPEDFRQAKAVYDYLQKRTRAEKLLGKINEVMAESLASLKRGYGTPVISYTTPDYSHEEIITAAHVLRDEGFEVKVHYSDGKEHSRIIVPPSYRITVSVPGLEY